MLGLTWEPFSEAEEKQILSAIKAAEQTTSGEIRVHIDKWCKTDPVFKAQNLFGHLKMDETKLRNGVLIYIALHEHKFAIVGDIEIDNKVGSHFWESTKDKMASNFKQGAIINGICEGIKEAGIQLQKYFPYDRNSDENELTDDISYG